MTNQSPPSTLQGPCPSLHSNSYFFLYIAGIFIFISVIYISILASVVPIVVCIACVVFTVERSVVSVANMPCVCTLCRHAPHAHLDMISPLLFTESVRLVPSMNCEVGVA